MIHCYEETFVVVKLLLLKPFGILTLSNISKYYSLLMLDIIVIQSKFHCSQVSTDYASL